MRRKNISPCGTICSDCIDYPQNCSGCLALQGKVHWVNFVNLEICPLYDCPVNQHNYKTCAECANIPCQKWKDLKDPDITDEIFNEEITKRLENLQSTSSKTDLITIPSVGENIKEDLLNIGITCVEDLVGKNPEELYIQDCQYKGFQEDKCQLYVFRTAVYYAENETHDTEKLKWWYWKDKDYPNK